jgi:hypothetical protein
MIDWSIRLGDIAVLAGLAGTSITLAFKAGSFSRSILDMQAEIGELKEVAKTISGVLTTVAVQKAEIEHLRTDIDDMRRGRGFITQN